MADKYSGGQDILDEIIENSSLDLTPPTEEEITAVNDSLLPQEPQEEKKPYYWEQEDFKPENQPVIEEVQEEHTKETDNALERGIERAKKDLAFTKEMATGDYTGAAQVIKEGAEYDKANPATEERKEIGEAWDSGEGVLGGVKSVANEVFTDFSDADGVWNKIKSLTSNATALGGAVVEQTPNMVAPMAGFAIGSWAGSPIPLVGNLAGGFIGASTGNAMVEGRGIALYEMQEAGINPYDVDAVAGFLEKNSTSLFGKTATKAAIIGAIDTATMRVGSKILKGPAKAASIRALTDMGTDVTDKVAVKAAMETPLFRAKVLSDPIFRSSQQTINKVGRNLTAAGLEPLGEFSGEYLGSGVALGDWETKNAALEAFSSLGQSAATYIAQKGYQYGTQGVPYNLKSVVGKSNLSQKQQSDVLNALAGDSEVREKAGAANAVYNDLVERGQSSLAEKWRIHAQHSINNNLPLSPDAVFAEIETTYNESVVDTSTATIDSQGDKPKGVVEKVVEEQQSENIEMEEGAEFVPAGTQPFLQREYLEAYDQEHGTRFAKSITQDFVNRINEKKDREEPLTPKETRIDNWITEQASKHAEQKDSELFPEPTVNDSFQEGAPVPESQYEGVSISEVADEPISKVSAEISPEEQNLSGTLEDMEANTGGKELLWKGGHDLNAASTASTPKPLTGDDKSPPLSGQSNVLPENNIEQEELKNKIKPEDIDLAENKTYTAETVDNKGIDTFAETDPNNYETDERNRQHTRRLEQALIKAGNAQQVTPVSLPDSVLGRTGKRRTDRKKSAKGGYALAEKLSKLFDKQIVWSTIGSEHTVSGLVVRNSQLGDKIFLDVRSDIPAHVILGHELSHTLEKDAPQVFQELLETLVPFIKDQKLYREKYEISKEDLTDNEVTKEIVGDLLGDSFADKNFWRRVAEHNQTGFRRIASKIMRWFNRLIRKIQGSPSLALQSDAFVSDLKAARAALAKATAEYGNVRKGGVFTEALKDIDNGILNDTPVYKQNLRSNSQGEVDQGNISNFSSAKNDIRYLKAAKTYTENRNIAKSGKRKIARHTKSFANDIISGLDKYLGATSTRLKKINPKLEAKFRKLDFDIGTNSTKDVKSVSDLLEKSKKVMSRDDFIDWDYARKNRDTLKIDELVTKYNLTLEYEKYRTTLEQIRNEALAVGLDVGHLEAYSPRVVKDTKGFLLAIDAGDDRAVISGALEDKARRLGVEVADLTIEQKVDTISNYLYRGPGSGKPGSTKHREINFIPPHLNQFYMHSDAALVSYIHSMRKAIEIRRFFGKMPERMIKVKQRLHSDIKRLKVIDQNKIGNATIAKDLKERIQEYNVILERYKAQSDYSENISSYILELLAKREIEPSQETELKEIMHARFNEKGTRGVVQTYKNFSYIDTMGSPISAVTQIGDLAWSAYENGIGQTLRHAVKSLNKSVRVKKEDVGIERIAQEFADGDTFSNAVAKVFKLVGLEKMDSIGKESMLNASLERFEARALKDPNGLADTIRPILGKETNRTIKDLQRRNITDNVLLLTYSKLLDYQPAALSEMPQKYLEAGNGRIFYMLKSYTIKQFDVYRREVFSRLRSGNSEQRVVALKNLIALSSLIVLANGGADELKDFILNRETSFSDRLIENILKLVGVSRFITWRARAEGVGSAVATQILPPFKFINSAWKDLNTAGDDKGFYTLSSVPVVGKVVYWHFGRGESSRLDNLERKMSAITKTLVQKEEVAQRSSAAAKRYQSELIKLRAVRYFRRQLLKNKKHINKLKAAKKGGADVDKAIEWLENTRADRIENFLSQLD